MTGAEHYRAAEQLLLVLKGSRANKEDLTILTNALLQQAQVHATLAMAAVSLEALLLSTRLAEGAVALPEDG